MKNNFLNEKEYNEITKAHKDFDQTIFGKKIKIFMSILSCFTLLFLVVGLVLVIFNDLNQNNFDVYAAICIAVFFINFSLMLVSLMLYENAVMNFMNYKNKK